MTDYPKNSMFYWYPKVKDLGIPMPETILFPFTEGVKDDRYKLFDGKEAPIYEVYIKELQLKATDLDLPLFMRSDQTSHKHGWEKTCYITDIAQIPNNAYQIVEFTEMAGWMGGLDIDGFVLREYLKLDTRFTAFHGKMPVAKEFRFFVKDGNFQCYHPYWFPACMVRPSIDEWHEELMDLENITLPALERLTNWAELIGDVVGGYWSVDFCQLKDESWAMTDMATGEDSFHFNSCEHAQESMKRYPDPYSMPDRYNLGR